MAAWDLSVTVEDLGPDAPPVTISVASDLHVGGVIVKLVEKTQIQRDWSDHALWWDQKKMWLLRTAWTLEKYGIHADARLIFMPQHRPLKLDLPNGKTTPPAPEVITKQYRPASVVDKAHINGRWLDSSRCLMQQNIQENDRLWLRFKYYTFYEIDPKYDVVRLTQLYEQARWAILLEDIDCTEEEMMLFGALQYHISKVSQSEPQTLSTNTAMDDLESALLSLEVKMEGESSSATELLETMTAPELNDYLKIFR
uniref:Fermitin family member 3b n=1 Tax=Nothobranchius rachovii TaxID=451742 RepID=A0A1A8RBD6_9TELE